MRAFGKTHKGIVRRTNQDFFLLDVLHEESIAIMAICDGMGGANAGNVASKFAAQSFIDGIKRSIKPDMSRVYAENIINEAVLECNRYVYELSKRQEEFEGMGTTITAAIVTKYFTVVANVGDSRAYLIENSSIKQITEDHSFVAELIKKGHITKEEAETHPERHYITRAIGFDDLVDIDIFSFRNHKGRILLLCSDGLTRMIKDEELGKIILETADLDECCDKLIDLANLRGGLDNITIVLLVMD